MDNPRRDTPSRLRPRKTARMSVKRFDKSPFKLSKSGKEVPVANQEEKKKDEEIEDHAKAKEITEPK